MTLGLVCDACDTLSPLTATVCPVCSAPLGVGPQAGGGKPGSGGGAMAARHCPNCNNEVPREHRFCGHCGTRVEATTDLRPAWAHVHNVRARLVLIKGEGQDGPAFPLGDAEHAAGRLEGGIMFPEDPLLSPRHATFFFRENKLYVRDDSSRNGVFVRLRGPKLFGSGAVLLLGEQLLRVEACPAEEAPIPDAEATYFYASPHRPSRLALVQLLVGGEVGLVYRARTDNITVGREGNDVNFPEDPFISGRHAQVVAVDDGRFQVTDLGSKNGTYEKIPTLAQLFPGDHVFLGQQLFRVEING
jgi:pSer/pThr/pTyr-binding forkhead associated (FHA) protein/RNA polymerase subunit RPABC4/transcription elongation factor Spt4